MRSIRAPLVLACALGILLFACEHSSTAPSTPTPVALSLDAPGQSASYLTSPEIEVNLAMTSGAQYLIAVVNTDTSATVREDFTLVGTGPAAGSGTVAAATARPARTAPLASPIDVGSARARSAALIGAQFNHVKMLEHNAQVFQRYRASGGAASARAASAAASQVHLSISQVIGAVQKIYVAKSFGGSCTNVDSIGARTVAVGQHVIVLADTNQTAWPAALRPDTTFYQAFATEYDTLTFPHILTYIGNPLAYDSHLSGTGKVTVVISPVLNSFGGGIVAFTDACDFYPVIASGSNADLDNLTEMFYYWIPGTNGWNVSEWERLMRATAAHETKHIVSYADRIINNSSAFEDIWLEEGLAQESSEIWERHFSQATWKGNANFAQTIDCEINLSGSTCDPGSTKPIDLSASHFPFLFQYLQEETTTSPSGHGLGTDTPSNYGAGWELSRWSTDQYASSEATFIQSLINEPKLTGLGNLSNHSGKSVAELLVYWGLASAIFQTPTYTAADVRTTVPSFNLANIFSVGQTQVTCGGSACGLWASNQGTTPVYPVQPTPLSSGSFSSLVTGVPGTTVKYFLLTAAASGTENITLESGSAGTLSTSSGFRVGILRVQ